MTENPRWLIALSYISTMCFTWVACDLATKVAPLLINFFIGLIGWSTTPVRVGL